MVIRRYGDRPEWWISPAAELLGATPGVCPDCPGMNCPVSYRGDVDDVDDKDRRYLEETLSRSGPRGRVDRADRCPGRPPAAGPSSSLRGDDDQAHPYDLSHAAWHSAEHRGRPPLLPARGPG